jgi:GrpB-like predicted nucleotidyltransferase (UPF0157 family)
MKVEVVPHDPSWRIAFETESKLVSTALGQNVVAIHHIGSTSIPNMPAKSIIDMLIEVNDIDEVDDYSVEMESLGYEVMGEFGIAGRRYFRKDNREGARTHQIHIFETGSDHITRHLAFRDYLIAHSDDAIAYSDLKRSLVEQFDGDTESYIDGKDSFIKDIDRRAAAWFAEIQSRARRT